MEEKRISDLQILEETNIKTELIFVNNDNNKFDMSDLLNLINNNILNGATTCIDQNFDGTISIKVYPAK